MAPHNSREVTCEEFCLLFGDSGNLPERPIKLLEAASHNTHSQAVNTSWFKSDVASQVASDSTDANRVLQSAIEQHPAAIECADELHAAAEQLLSDMETQHMLHELEQAKEVYDHAMEMFETGASSRVPQHSLTACVPPESDSPEQSRAAQEAVEDAAEHMMSLMSLRVTDGEQLTDQSIHQMLNELVSAKDARSAERASRLDAELAAQLSAPEALRGHIERDSAAIEIAIEERAQREFVEREVERLNAQEASRLLVAQETDRADAEEVARLQAEHQEIEAGYRSQRNHVMWQVLGVKVAEEDQAAAAEESSGKGQLVDSSHSTRALGASVPLWGHAILRNLKHAASPEAQLQRAEQRLPLWGDAMLECVNAMVEQKATPCQDDESFESFEDELYASLSCDGQPETSHQVAYLSTEPVLSKDDAAELMSALLTSMCPAEDLTKNRIQGDHGVLLHPEELMSALYESIRVHDSVLPVGGHGASTETQQLMKSGLHSMKQAHASFKEQNSQQQIINAMQNMLQELAEAKDVYDNAQMRAIGLLEGEPTQLTDKAALEDSNESALNSDLEASARVRGARHSAAAVEAARVAEQLAALVEAEEEETIRLEAQRERRAYRQALAVAAELNAQEEAKRYLASVMAAEQEEAALLTASRVKAAEEEAAMAQMEEDAFTEAAAFMKAAEEVAAFMKAAEEAAALAKAAEEAAALVKAAEEAAALVKAAEEAAALTKAAEEAAALEAHHTESKARIEIASQVASTERSRTRVAAVRVMRQILARVSKGATRKSFLNWRRLQATDRSRVQEVESLRRLNAAEDEVCGLKVEREQAIRMKAAEEEAADAAQMKAAEEEAADTAQMKAAEEAAAEAAQVQAAEEEAAAEAAKAAEEEAAEAAQVQAAEEEAAAEAALARAARAAMEATRLKAAEAAAEATALMKAAQAAKAARLKAAEDQEAAEAAEDQEAAKAAARLKREHRPTNVAAGTANEEDLSIKRGYFRELHDSAHEIGPSAGYCREMNAQQAFPAELDTTEVDAEAVMLRGVNSLQDAYLNWDAEDSQTAQQAGAATEQSRGRRKLQSRMGMLLVDSVGQSLRRKALFTGGKHAECVGVEALTRDLQGPKQHSRVPEQHSRLPEQHRVEEQMNSSAELKLQEMRNAAEEEARVNAAEEAARVKAADETARMKYYEQALGLMDQNIHQTSSAPHPGTIDSQDLSVPSAKLRSIEAEVEVLEAENRELQSKLTGVEEITNNQPDASSDKSTQDAPTKKQVDTGSKVLRAFKSSSELLSIELASHRSSILGIMTRYSTNEAWNDSFVKPR